MMIKSKRIPASEIKNIRCFGADVQIGGVVISELKRRPIPDSEIKNIRSFGVDRIAAPGKAEK